MDLFKQYRFLAVTVFLFFILLFPLVLNGQGLVPCDGSEENPCDYNAFIRGIEILINWFILVGASASAIGFAWVGFIYITQGANPSKRAEANQTFTKIAIGFFFILGAWLIVKLILVGLGADLAQFPLG